MQQFLLKKSKGRKNSISSSQMDFVSLTVEPVYVKIQVYHLVIKSKIVYYRPCLRVLKFQLYIVEYFFFLNWKMNNRNVNKLKECSLLEYLVGFSAQITDFIKSATRTL